MMDTFVAILYITLIASPVQKFDPMVNTYLQWRDIDDRYRSIHEIRPTLVNEADRSIFLYGATPGHAQLMRFNEVTGKWEASGWHNLRVLSWTASEPIEVRPGGKIKLRLALSLNGRESPQLFITENDASKRSMRGKYKMVVQYTLEVERESKPQLFYVTESPTFLIVR